MNEDELVDYLLGVNIKHIDDISFWDALKNQAGEYVLENEEYKSGDISGERAVAETVTEAEELAVNAASGHLQRPADESSGWKRI